MTIDIVEGSTANGIFHANKDQELPRSASTIGFQLVNAQNEPSSSHESQNDKLQGSMEASASFVSIEDETAQTSPTFGILGDSQFFSDGSLLSPSQTPRKKKDLNFKQERQNEPDTAERKDWRLEANIQQKENKELKLQLQEEKKQNAILLKKINDLAHDQNLDKSISEVNVVECKQDALLEQKNSGQILDVGFVPIVIPRGNIKLTEQNFKLLLKEHVQGEQKQSSDKNSDPTNRVLYHFVAETFKLAHESFARYLKIKKLSYENSSYLIIAQYRKIPKENPQLDVPCFIYGAVNYEIHYWDRIEFTFQGSFRTVSEVTRKEKTQSREATAFLSTLQTIRNEESCYRRIKKENVLSCLEKGAAAADINFVKVQLEEEIKSCNTSSFYGQKSYLCNFFPSVSLRLRSKVARKEIKLKFLNELLNEIEHAKVDTTIGDIVNKLAFEYKNKSESEWEDVKAGISSERLGISTSKTFNLLKSLGYNQKIVDELVSLQQLRAASQ